MIEMQAVRRTSAEFPRVYRVKRNPRALLWTLFVLVGLPAFVGALYCATGHLVRNPGGGARAAIFFAVVVLLTLYAVAWARIARITLWADRIEIRGFFRRQTLLCHDIQGYRTNYSSNDSGRISFQSRDGKEVSISRAYDFDDSFSEWMSSLTDLNAEERRASEEAITHDERFGRRRLDRKHALRRAKRVSAWLNGAAFLLFAWGAIVRVPELLSLLVLIAFPLLIVVLVAQSRGLCSLDQSRTDIRPNLTIPFMLPGIALAMRASWDANLLSARGALYITVIVACMFAGSALMVQRPSDQGTKKSRASAVLFLVLALPYGFGAGMECNFRLDRSEPQEYRARVIEKDKHNPRDSFYYLQLAPWGPRQLPDRVGVPWRLYDSSQVGGDVCVTLYRGAFRVPWYKVHACGNGKESAEASPQA